MKRISRNVFLSLFLLIICTPVLLQIASVLLEERFDIALGGYTDRTEQVDFTLRSYVSGDFQKNSESWLNANLQPRGVLIRLYNQIRYSAFRLANEIIGSDGNLFGMREYANDALCTADFD